MSMLKHDYNHAHDNELIIIIFELKTISHEGL